MKIKQLGHNEIMIVSKYFDGINDFINLELGVKRYRGNMERFRFNPIPLDDYSRKFFPNIETLNLYNKDDMIFNDGKIFKQMIWYKVEYSTYLKEKEQGNECKSIEYTEYDREEFGDEIPPEVNSLGDNCFEGYDSFKMVIPSSVTKLGMKCFSTSEVEDISISNAVISIGNACFSFCTNLKKIQLPENICIIPNECFASCTNLLNVTIPSSVSSLGNNAFSFCSSLLECNLPISLRSIQNNCFNGSTSLTSLSLPINISNIGMKVLKGCSSLKSIDVPEPYYLFNRFVLFNRELIGIKLPKSLKEINHTHIQFDLHQNHFEIPRTCTSIGSCCFAYCHSLKSVSIYSNITGIKDRAFYECNNLTSICLPNTIKELNEYTFDSCTSLSSIHFSNKLESIKERCFQGCLSLNQIDIPTTVTFIGDEALPTNYE
ncbi:leucine rich repeat protein, BspA family protein [Entamoeba histolytica HM-1:IMSS-B]|uniref:Leucine rich repeat protein, BspA family n=5 Tax=Entamoeba histolytica TaxID=5759 RepID=C4M4R9_ENTH1|nr:uncharacterized protein EHI_095060 [Entamoeba histolytica HM-1:IMSS]EMD47614.1 leucine rich repeatcontaining protein BspA family protein [Entamoeba histolytica KU27]EMH77341.1 leucine rich repeat protein, BspA family protein [Entamoeba histolytica HM-1:IMSS-B]ENY65653.1 leucine rich repeat protein, bspa family protein [Entamoeba histolytica HM-1:IMSS-A]GAT96375.1 leucine rich repeat protein bspa family [Entamoeba histolytica]EAL48368.1 leucine rich repeat protein, BspA family [Entamoeba his|eukprot:XP_653754.1 uncharacterized protein EHI_095060 [Entamoeba histolytica HM-1:IMSS]